MFKLMISLGCVSTVLPAYLLSPCSNAIYLCIVPLVGEKVPFSMIGLNLLCASLIASHLNVHIARLKAFLNSAGLSQKA